MPVIVTETRALGHTGRNSSAVGSGALGFGNPQSAIAVAYHVCDALDGGMEPSDISRHLTAANSGIDQQAGLVITVAAAQAYCPRFVHQMANGTIVVGPDHYTGTERRPARRKSPKKSSPNL